MAKDPRPRPKPPETANKRSGRHDARFFGTAAMLLLLFVVGWIYFGATVREVSGTVVAVDEVRSGGGIIGAAALRIRYVVRADDGTFWRGETKQVMREGWRVTLTVSRAGDIRVRSAAPMERKGAAAFPTAPRACESGKGALCGPLSPRGRGGKIMRAGDLERGRVASRFFARVSGQNVQGAKDPCWARMARRVSGGRLG